MDIKSGAAAHAHDPAYPLAAKGTPKLKSLLLISSIPPARALFDHFSARGIDLDLVQDGIGAVKRLWEHRYDAILAEAHCARVGGHRLGDVVADIAPGTAVVVLKTGQRVILPDDAGAEPMVVSDDPGGEARAALMGELLLSVGVAIQRRATRRK
jgi:hypothetical protein